jgi:hypothetical protein
VTRFIVELYVPGTDAGAAARDAERARRGAEELSREGLLVDLIQSIYVPEDETCFLLYESATAELVRAAAERAGLPSEHVAEALLAGP